MEQKENVTTKSEITSHIGQYEGPGSQQKSPESLHYAEGSGQSNSLAQMIGDTHDQSHSQRIKNSIEPIGSMIKETLELNENNNEVAAEEEDMPTLVNASLGDIVMAHNTNQLSLNQYKSAKEFMSNVMFRVPLKKLYRVMASCNYNANADFCPVLLEIIDEKILRNNADQKFLLQVWTKNGVMVFEKALDYPVCNWNIAKDKFVFQLSPDSPQIYLVKLYLEKQATVFKFTIPTQVLQGRTNTKYDKYRKRFVIPDERDFKKFIPGQRGEDAISDSDLEVISECEENEVAQHEAEGEDYAQMLARGELSVRLTAAKVQDIYQSIVTPDSQKTTQKYSMNELFSDRLMKRAPDKMIDYVQGCILLAYRNSIIYLDVSKFGVEDETQIPQESRSTDTNMVEVEITGQDLSNLDLLRKYKIICLQEIGEGLTAVVLENLETRQLRFLRANYKQKYGKKRLQLLQLGILVNKTTLSPSRLLKYRSVAKIDPTTKRSYQVSLALRENGRFEVYSDFMLVNEYFNSNLQCVDIETDFDQFYLKFIEEADSINKGTPIKSLKQHIRTVRHFWRNNISFNTSKKHSNIKKWKYVLHNRIANYFRLYSQILNFSMFILVSHRNMISIYDKTNVTKDTPWSDTIDFNEGFVRNFTIKRRPKIEKQSESITSIYKKFHIVALVGSGTIHYRNINAKGIIQRTDSIESKMKPLGRILKFFVDEKYQQGILLLVDQLNNEQYIKKQDYKIHGDCKLYTFPLQFNNTDDKNAMFVIYSLKAQKLYRLIDSKGSKCVNHDSYFNVVRANREVFETPVDEFRQKKDPQSINCEVRNEFQDKNYVNVMICTSRANNCERLFPIVKNRDKETNLVDKIRLLKQKVNCRETVNASKKHQIGKPVHSFYLTSSEFEDNIDDYAKVSYNEIKFFDKNMQERLSYKGLNIRGSQDVHQGYLYTLSDSITSSPVMITRADQGAEEEVKQLENQKFSGRGFYCYDLSSLSEGKIEKYKLVSAIGGVNNQIDISKFDNRLTFIQNFDYLAIIPFPHLNLINCEGMGQKNGYLVWREKNGFFTALDRRGNLNTWSLTSGKLLYSENQNKSQNNNDVGGDQLEQYQVYKADKEDNTYLRNFYNFDQSSISLLRSDEPLDTNLAKKQKKLNREFCEFKLDKQNMKNKSGLINLDHDLAQLETNLFQVTSPDQGTQVKVLDSQQKTDLFHFKVIQLRSHEDTSHFSECKLKFHFLFGLIKKKTRQHLQQFDWDICAQPQQRLYLSRDTNKMMEVVNGFIATVYYRVNISTLIGQKYDKTIILKDQGQDDGQQVKWKVDYRIKRFPKSISSITSVPYLFSPNFTYQIDFNYRTNQFVILESRTQHVYMYIPNDLISTSWKNRNDSLQIIFSRMKWHDERILRIVNESNMDCLFQMCYVDSDDKTKESRYLKLISSVKIDNQYENTDRLDSPNILCDQAELQSQDVLDRLIRTSQDYKISLMHAINTHDLKFNLLEKINKIDYLQNWKSKTAGFEIEMPFTFLDWNICEMIQSDETFDLAEINIEQQIQICFTILPKGQSIFHLLAKCEESNSEQQTNDQVKAFFTTKDLFAVASQEHQLEIAGAEDGTNFEIPILPDMYGANPLDYCLGISKKRKQTKKIFYQNKQIRKEIKGSQNIALANVILDGIKEYGFMHSSFLITEAVIKATRIALPSVGEYLDSRLQKVQHQFKSKNLKIFKENRKRFSPSMGDYGTIRSLIQSTESSIKKKLFKQSGQTQPMNLEYLDIPYLDQHTPEGSDFIAALDQSQDLEIFNHKSVQILIDSHQATWKKTQRYLIVLPMIFQLATFWYWSNIILSNEQRFTDDQIKNTQEKPEKNNIEKESEYLETILLVTAIYLLFYEMSKKNSRELNFKKNIRTLFSMLPNILLIISVYQIENTAYFWDLQTWTALLIWLRFLQFLGSFSAFNWLIRMIFACIYDMILFLIVLMISVSAFADIFLSIDKVLEIQQKLSPYQAEDSGSLYQVYFQQYSKAWQNSFLVMMAVFDESHQEDFRPSDWLVFLICNIINFVLLLNLLVSIISETYENASSNRVPNSYKEKVSQINGIQGSIFGLYKRKVAPMEMMLIARVIDNQEEIRTIVKELTVDEKIDRFIEKVQVFSQEIDSHCDQRLSLLYNQIVARLESLSGEVDFQPSILRRISTIKSPIAKDIQNQSQNDLDLAAQKKLKRRQIMAELAWKSSQASEKNELGQYSKAKIIKRNDLPKFISLKNKVPYSNALNTTNSLNKTGKSSTQQTPRGKINPRILPGLRYSRHVRQNQGQ